MTLTKKLKTEILKAYHDYWDAYLKGDMRTMSYWMHDKVQMIGSGRGEFFKNKKETISYYKSTAGQVSGKADMRNRKISLVRIGDQVMVNEQCDFFVLIGSVWTFYEQGRISTLFTKTNKGWKIIEEHSSIPDTRTEGGEPVNTDKIKAENIRLKDAVKRRTIELEEKNQDLKIEAALERVRAVAMAMKKSMELTSVCEVMYQELISLGFTNLRNAQIAILDEKKKSYEMYAFSPLEKITGIETRYDNSPSGNILFQKLGKSNKGFYEKQYSKKDMEEWRTWRKSIAAFHDPRDETVDSLCWYLYAIGNGHIGISTFNTITGEQVEIVKRFKNVFVLSYQRYIDITKAEAQARDAQIETALERVRSCSMGMQKSEELKDVINLVYEQFVHLNIHIEHTGFLIDYKTRDDLHIWLADHHLAPSEVFIPFFDCPPNNSIWEAKEKGKDFFKYHLDFEEKNKFYRELFQFVPGVPEETINYYLNCPGLAGSGVLLDSIGLYIENFSGTPYTDDENAVLMRFGKVFQQTYTRFLDLQKAEAQAREAQIEAALERVRSRAMAMHTSQELKDVAIEMRHQLCLLGQKELETCAIHLWDESSGWFEGWAALRSPDNTGQIIESESKLKIKGIKILEESFQNYQDGKKDYIIINDVAKAKEFFKALKLVDPTAYAFLSPTIKHKKPEDICAYWSVSDFDGGSLVMVTMNPPEENSRALLRRFSDVFGLAYRRFSDLKKAEKQAREAQIEAALERVRASTMAMQKSEDLKNIVKVVLQQFKQLEFVMEGGAVHIGIFNDGTKVYTQWSAEPLLEIVDSYNVPYNNIPLFADVLKAKKSGKDFFFQKYSNEEKNKWFDWAFVHSDFKQLPDEFKKVLKECNSYAHWTAFQKNSLITINNVLDKSLSPEQIAILKRFSEVFEQAYTRFLDLQKAEVNAKEAVKQAALDRIRADIASMRTVSDLDRITPLIWKEMNVLGIPFIRCGVFIMDDEQEIIHIFLSTPDGKAITTFHVPYDTPGKIRLIPEYWKKKAAYTDHWNDSDFVDFAETLVKNHVINSSEQYLSDTPHGGFYLHFVPFNQGMMYAGNATTLNEEQISLIQSVADAFSTAYARYEDFNKLETAKKQVDHALKELKSAQKQLIQSEKMASLGELTAGIAHEIQNPLNFVNNFSEVSVELANELKGDIGKLNIPEDKKGNIDADINDLVQNQQKINFHGKRADAIVKAMLQHSRISSGQRELTNINALADEYLRLSYHGMRAKDKSFNAEMKTDFDETIGRINVVPQDIGRVFLNLFNNAFYAIHKKQETSQAEPAEGGYQPTVWVSTKKEGNYILIKVRDNGGGIPEKVKDKIFQPFFTTKPTGEGTGLGLSLSYDIIKAHDGDIKVNTKEGEGLPAGETGTEFVVKLPVVN